MISLSNRVHGVNLASHSNSWPDSDPISYLCFWGGSDWDFSIPLPVWGCVSLVGCTTISHLRADDGDRGEPTGESALSISVSFDRHGINPLPRIESRPSTSDIYASLIPRTQIRFLFLTCGDLPTQPISLCFSLYEVVSAGVPSRRSGDVVGIPALLLDRTRLFSGSGTTHRYQ